MRFSDKAGMAWNSLLKRKLRTMLTILGVMIGVASIVTMMALAEGLKRQSMEMIEEYGGLRTVEVREGSGQSAQTTGGDASGAASDPTKYKLSDSTMEMIGTMDHVESVYPTLEFQAVILSGPYHMDLYSGQAVPVEVLHDMNWEFAEGEWPKAGDELKFVYGNMVKADFADSRGNIIYWNTGKTVDVDMMESKLFTIFDVEAYNALHSNNKDSKSSETAPAVTTENAEGKTGENESSAAPTPPKKYMVPTAGVLEGSMDDYYQYSWNTYCDLEALQAMLKKVFKNKPIPGQPVKKNGKPYPELFYSKLNVIVDDIDNVADVQKAIGDLGYQANSNSEWIAQAREQSQSQQAMLGGIGAVSLLVAAIGIANTMMMSIYERTKEIGVMKVLGCGLYDIQQMFLVEAGLIGIGGGITGLALSFIVCIIINKVTAAQTAVIPVWMYFTSVVFAVIVSMLAGYAPSKRAMALSALEAIRSN